MSLTRKGNVLLWPILRLTFWRTVFIRSMFRCCLHKRLAFRSPAIPGARFMGSLPTPLPQMRVTPTANTLC